MIIKNGVPLGFSGYSNFIQFHHSISIGIVYNYFYSGNPLQHSSQNQPHGRIIFTNYDLKHLAAPSPANKFLRGVFNFIR